MQYRRGFDEAALPVRRLRSAPRPPRAGAPRSTTEQRPNRPRCPAARSRPRSPAQSSLRAPRRSWPRRISTPRRQDRMVPDFTADTLSQAAPRIALPHDQHTARRLQADPESPAWTGRHQRIAVADAARGPVFLAWRRTSFAPDRALAINYRRHRGCVIQLRTLSGLIGYRSPMPFLGEPAVALCAPRAYRRAWPATRPTLVGQPDAEVGTFENWLRSRARFIPARGWRMLES